MAKTTLVAALAVVLAAATLVAAGTARTTAASAFDEHWLKTSAEGDIYEVAVGNLALQKGASYSCGVAKMLVDDDSKALAEAKALAKKLRIKLPTRANPLQRAIIVELSQASGFSFQRMFAGIGIADHQIDIAEANETAKKAAGARVKAAAGKELPVLKKHLATFNDVLRTTLTSGGSTTGTTTTPASATTTSSGAPQATGCS